MLEDSENQLLQLKADILDLTARLSTLIERYESKRFSSTATKLRKEASFLINKCKDVRKAVQTDRRILNRVTYKLQNKNEQN